MKELFEMMDRVAGDKLVYMGLQYKLPTGFIIIDTAVDVEVPDGNGGKKRVDGFVVDYAPFDESPAQTFFVLDEEGISNIVNIIVPSYSGVKNDLPLQ